MTAKRAGTITGSLGLVLALLAACQSTGGLGDDRRGPPPPPGTPRITQPVSQKTVGHRLMAAGEYELALRAYYRAAAEEGMTPELLASIGSANMMLGRLGQAERVLRRATELDPKSVAAWNNLGVVLLEKGEIAEARRVFQLAFALDRGRSAEIRENLRLAIAKLQDSSYDAAKNKNQYGLSQHEDGQYLVLTKAEGGTEQ